ncbi:hypothetical protein PCASD_14193 [Puccinia coronata f. sp. avenae]|uniref:Rnh202 triple barrel domain-containing protein n=1 Tax=Puccinia coronata f. sp. avenae TaxID=200324 RepID=A0A2N5U3H7_9BASI|nr:hypothetical protein PCASD_14193 [Puccinia coronata f. sp. avenae]
MRSFLETPHFSIINLPLTHVPVMMMASDPIILPSCLLELNSDLPVIRLPHPKTRRPALFVVRAGHGIWEIQSIASPSSSSRSWFFQPVREDQPDQLMSQHAGRLLVVTPFDPFFLLLGLFCCSQAHPFLDLEKKDTSHRARFEEIDAMLERIQELWLFADSTEGPTPGDVELFTREAFQAQNLDRIFEPLHQEERGTTLWRPDPERILREIQRKVHHLAAAGLRSGREARSIWTRLASKEGLFNFDETPDNLLIINDIYQKVALDMVQACLPDPIRAHLHGLAEYGFEALKAANEKQASKPTLNPLEIGRRVSHGTDSKAKNPAKPPPAKRKKTEDTLRNQPKVTLHHFFKPPAS